MQIAAILFFILMFFVFIFAFRRIINRNITSAVQHLDQINQDYLKKEEEANKKLEEAERMYQEMLTKSKEEALSARQDILKQTQEEKESILQKARVQAEEAIKQADKTRQLLIKEVEERIDKESVKKASLLLSQVLPEDIRSKVHASVVSEFIKGGLSNLDKLSVPKEVKEVKLVSALELDKKEKDAILKICKEKLGREFKLSEEVDQELVAGCMVILGSLVIDASLRFKVGERTREILNK